MPTSSGEYVGDQSGVLPSNTAAMLHFSDQFAKLAAQKRRQQAMQQREDENRKIALQKYLGTSLDNKEFNTQTDAQGVIDTNLQDLRKKAILMMNSGAPVSDVMGLINDGVSGTLEKARSVTNINKGILASVATIKAHNPELDDKALFDAAAKGEFFDTDKDGNPVLKQDYSNTDPTQVGMRVLDIYKKNPELFYPAGSADKSLQGFVNGQKLADVGEEPTYDAKGNRIGYGYKGKLPPFVSVQTDNNGKTIYDDKGKPKIDIAGSYNYRIPGQDHDYVNNQGQKVKVVPTETYNQLPDPVKAQIEKEVKDQTAQAGVEPDGEYANMLRGNLAYNKLLGLANNTYKFNTPKDESFDRKKALFSQGIQQAHLEISKRNASRGEQEFQYRKDKDAGKLTDANGNAVESNFDKYTSNPQTIPNPLGGDIKFIDANQIPKDVYYQMTGNTSSVKGDVGGVHPMEVDGKKVFLLDENGQLHGQDGIIDKTGADQRQIKAIPKSKKTIVQRAKDAVQKVVKNFKGTDKSLY